MIDLNDKQVRQRIKEHIFAVVFYEKLDAFSNAQQAYRHAKEVVDFFEKNFRDPYRNES